MLRVPAPVLLFDLNPEFPVTGLAIPISLGNVQHSITSIDVTGLAFPFAGGLATPPHQHAVAGLEPKLSLGRVVHTSADVDCQMLIAGVDQTSFVHLASPITITSALNGRGTMNFALVDETYGYRPAIGQEVRWILNQTVEFSGLVQEVREAHATNSDPTSPVGKPQVVCTDYAAILDKRVLVQTFAAGVTAKEAIQSVVTTVLSQEGISFNDGDTDPGALDDRLFLGVTATDFMQRVARETGFDWRIDFDKVLHFFDPSIGSGSAPVSIADNDGNVVRNSISVRDYRGLYRNVQHVRTSRPSGSLFSEIAPHVSGSTDNWGPLQTSAPIGETPPTIKLVGTISTIDPGIVITEAEYQSRIAANPFNSGDWHYKYTPGTNILENKTQNPVFIPGAPGYIGGRVAVTVSYATGEVVNAIVTVRNESEITARAAIEGGTGEHHHLEEVNDIETEQAATDLANGLLNRYSTMPKELRFSSDVAGWAPGQALTSTYTKPPASGTFHVTHVTKTSGVSGGSSLNVSGTKFMRSTITAVNGAAQDSALEEKRRLIDRDRPSRPRIAPPMKFMLGGTVSGLTNNGLDSLVVPSGGGTVTTSGTSVTGTGTTFLADYSVGDEIYVLDSVSPQRRTIDTIPSDTSMTVTAAFSPDASGVNHRKVFIVPQQHEIKQDGVIVSVSMIFNEPPTGVAGNRVLVDVLKNTTAAPGTYTSILSGAVFALASGTAANVPVSQPMNITASKGEALRVDVLDATSATPIRDGVVTVHQFV